MRVVYYERPAEAITVLRHVVTVIPERPCTRQGSASEIRVIRNADFGGGRTCLADRGKVVQKCFVRRDRALVHEGQAVDVGVGVLKDAVPMLVEAGGGGRGGGSGGVTVSARTSKYRNNGAGRNNGARRNQTTYDRGPGEHALVREQIDHADLEVVVLGRQFLSASSLLHGGR